MIASVSVRELLAIRMHPKVEIKKEEEINLKFNVPNPLKKRFKDRFEKP
jgi:hypothetical protein